MKSFSRVGKPSKSDCEGTGQIAEVNMPDAGRVKYLAPEKSMPDGIARSKNEQQPVKRDDGSCL